MLPYFMIITEWSLATQNIYVGPEGVAAAAILTSHQMIWYQMGEEVVPHVSLALHPTHQAKDLGPMVKRAVEVTDWLQTQIPQVSFSPGCKTYCISMTATDTVLLQHDQIFSDVYHDVTQATETL